MAAGISDFFVDGIGIEVKVPQWSPALAAGISVIVLPKVHVANAAASMESGLGGRNQSANSLLLTASPLRRPQWSPALAAGIRARGL